MSFCSGCGKIHQQCACEGRSRSKERRDKERREKRPAETEATDFWEKIENVLENKVVKKLEPRFERLEQGQNDLTTRAEKMEKRIEDLEQRPAEGSNGTWRPCAIWIKNFCDFDERRTKGISRLQMGSILSSLKGYLDPSLQPHVGDFEMVGSLNHKVKVRISPGYAHEIASIWKENFGEKETPNKEDLKFNGRVLFCHAERPPAEQTIYDKAGLTMAWLRSVAVDAEVRCTWKPDYTMQVVTDMGSTVTEVGNIQQDASIKWNPEGLKTAGGQEMTPELAEQKLTTFRSVKH